MRNIKIKMDKIEKESLTMFFEDIRHQRGRGTTFETSKSNLKLIISYILF